jgi:hypothetical protein
MRGFANRGLYQPVDVIPELAAKASNIIKGARGVRQESSSRAAASTKELRISVVIWSNICLTFESI